MASSPPASDDSTQPFSWSGHPHNTETKRHDDGPEGDDDVSTASDSSNEGEQDASEIDISCRPTIVTWKAADGHEQSTEGLRLDLYLNLATNTAFFKLYGHIFLKKAGKSNKQIIYLFIFPNHIKTIAWDTSSIGSSTVKSKNGTGSPSLCFTMLQPPSLVIPKGRVLESKKVTESLLNAILALARATTFTACVGEKTDLETQFALIASRFSKLNENKPCVNEKRANLKALYNGLGGEVVTSEPHPCLDEGAPPSYDNALSSGQPTSKKRRRRSDSLDNESTASLIRAMCSKLDRMQNQLNRLEDLVASTRPCPCRYGTEERTEILQAVDDRVEDSMMDARFELHDKLDETIIETREDIKEMQEDFQQNIKKMMNETITDVLSNTSVELNGKVTLKF